MSACLEDIKRYIEQGQKQNATHVIIACDTFDHDNYPVFVMPHENIQEKISHIREQGMQRVDEVYNLSKDIQKQLSTPRCFEC